MADEPEFSMTPTRLAVVMSNRVLREHQRIGRKLSALYESRDLAGLKRLADELLASSPTFPSAIIPDPTPSAEVVAQRAEEQRQIDDSGGLPEVRHRDDFEQGVTMALGQRQLARRLGRM